MSFDKIGMNQAFLILYWPCSSIWSLYINNRNKRMKPLNLAQLSPTLDSLIVYYNSWLIILKYLYFVMKYS